MNYISKIYDIKALLLYAVLLVTGCTKYANPPAHFESEEYEIEQEVKRKVLVISMDGTVGMELKDVMPATIEGLLAKSKYTFEALSETNTTDAATWMSMMSGVSYEKHHITSDNFIPTPDPSHPHASGVEYPSIFFRLGTTEGQLRTYAVTRNPNIGNRLLGAAYESSIGETDENVMKNTLEVLKKDRVDMLVVQFADVLEAGLAHGFKASVPEYKEAIVKVDAYVGQILKALKERKNYAWEDWLIVLTSNHGGIDKTYGGETPEERNIFALYANERFKKTELVPAFVESYRFFGYNGSNEGYAQGFRARNTVPPATESVYNVATTGELTVDAKIKVNPDAQSSFSYASNFPFLGKNADRSGSTPGWAFFKSGNSATIYMADGSNKVEGSMGQVSSSGAWAHICAVMGSENGVATIKTYVNGDLTGTHTNANVNIAKVLSSTGLTFGYFPTMFSGTAMDFQMADIRIWNKKLDLSEIKLNAREIGLNPEQQASPNLVGYWPMKNLANQQFVNMVPNRPNIATQGTSGVSVMTNTLPGISPDKILVQSTDVFPQVYYWLGLKTQNSWSLDGKVFLNRFEIEFL